MKKLVLAFCAIVISNAVYAGKDSTSIGWIVTGKTKGITIKQKISRNIILQGVLSKNSFSLKNPTLSEISTNELGVTTFTESEADADINFSGKNVGGRILYIISQERNMRTYIGTGINHSEGEGLVSIDTNKLSLDVGANEYSLVGGVDFQLQGLPSLSFTTEVGLSRTKYKAISGLIEGSLINNESIKYSLSPNATSNKIFVGFGMNYNLF